MRLESIRDKLPLDMQKLLEMKPDWAWFDTLRRAQEQSSHNGEHLAILFRYMVTNQVDKESIEDLSKMLSLLDAENGLNGLSEVAKETYRKAKSIFTAAHPSTTGKKRKGDDALEGEPSAKKQARIEMTEGDTIRSKIASESTLLPKELSGIVGEYAVDIPFPWKGETFTWRGGYKGELSPKLKESFYRLSIFKSAGSPTKEISIEIKNIVTNCSGINIDTKCDMLCQFMVVFTDGGRSRDKLQAYCEGNDIQYSTRDMFDHQDDIIMFCNEKKDAQSIMKFLTEHNEFPKEDLETIDITINELFLK